jgi:hypothetical protein
MAGLEAERLGHVIPPIERGPRGIEFYDNNGVPYDMKTPSSPNPGQHWSFDPEGAGESILD